MDIAYRFFLKIKYLKMLSHLDSFYQIYQDCWADEMPTIEDCMIIEEEELKRTLSNDQRKVDFDILNNPVVIANYVKIEKENIKSPDLYFELLKDSEKILLLDYLIKLKTHTDNNKHISDALFKTLALNLDYTKVPEKYFFMNVDELENEVSNISISFF